MKVGFTGTQKGMTDQQFKSVCGMLTYATEFHVGGCVGSDEQITKWILNKNQIEIQIQTNPSIITIHSHLPISKDKCSFAASFPCDWIKVYEDKHYLARNRDIVDYSDILIATPATDIEQLRSGTWYTVRYARKTGTPIIIVNPDGRIVRDPPEAPDYLPLYDEEIIAMDKSIINL